MPFNPSTRINLKKIKFYSCVISVISVMKAWFIAGNGGI
nr:MAG TPA: hypothetical protein [Caudoviricetes sp.]